MTPLYTTQYSQSVLERFNRFNQENPKCARNPNCARNPKVC